MKKFDVLGVIGSGAYGIVLKAKNKKTKEIVAIKKFRESDKESTIRKISLREIKFLKMVDHKNIVHLIETFRRKEKLHLIFEFAEKTILDVMKENPRGVHKDKIKYYLYQLMKAIDYLHERDIIHRDVKPENLLVNKNDILKLCDFGFARKIPTPGARLTDYVATRWYRSPELLLTDRYGKPSDMWAIGCIMAEMADGRPLFPGDDQFDQLYLVTKVLGNLPKDIKELFFANKEFRGMRLKNIKTPVTLEKKYKKAFKGIHMKFLKGLLEPSPSKRLTAKQALMHEYFKELREEDPEFMVSENASTTQRTVEIQRKPSSRYSNKNKFSVYDSIEISRRNNKSKKRRDDRQNSHSRTQNWSSSRSKNIRMNSIKEKAAQSRKTYSQKIKLPINPQSENNLGKKYGSIGKVKPPKTYYNIYEKTSNFGDESSLYGSRSRWRQPKLSTKTDGNKNYPVYTQLAFHKSKVQPKTLKTDTINGFTHEKGINSRFKLPIKRGHKHSETYKNTSSSLSQIHRKLGYKTTHKPFMKKNKNSSDKKSKKFNLGMSSIYTYDKMYKMKSNGKQLPTLNRNAFFVNKKDSYNMAKKKRKFRTVKRHTTKKKPFNGFNTMSITNAKIDLSPLTNNMV